MRHFHPNRIPNTRRRCFSPPQLLTAPPRINQRIKSRTMHVLNAFPQKDIRRPTAFPSIASASPPQKTHPENQQRLKNPIDYPIGTPVGRVIRSLNLCWKTRRFSLLPDGGNPQRPSTRRFRRGPAPRRRCRWPRPTEGGEGRQDRGGFKRILKRSVAGVCMLHIVNTI